MIPRIDRGPLELLGSRHEGIRLVDSGNYTKWSVRGLGLGLGEWMNLGSTLLVYEMTREQEMKRIVWSCDLRYSFDHPEDLKTAGLTIDLDVTVVWVQSCYTISLFVVSLKYSNDSLLLESMEGSVNPKSLVHRAGVSGSSANS